MADISKLWRENIDSILSEQTPDRIEKDKSRLQEIRSLTCLSPLGKKLLDWADDNDIIILMDNQVSGAGGYYCPGFKTIALATGQGNNYLAGTLAHEIRHAWQESEGLIPIFSEDDDKTLWPKIQDYMLQTRFFEADAFAVGEMVRNTVERVEGYNVTATETSKMKQFFYLMGDGIERTLFPETSKGLASKFNQFFNTKSKVGFYDGIILKLYARGLGVKGIVVPFSDMEYSDDKFNAPYSSGLDVHDEQSIRKLGDIFGEYNYLDNIPDGFNRDIKYCGRMDFSSLKDKTLQSPKQNEALFRQVKHLQKKHGIR